MEMTLRDYRHPYDCGKRYVIPVPDSTSIRERIVKKEIKADALVKLSENDGFLVLIYEFQKVSNEVD